MVPSSPYGPCITGNTASTAAGELARTVPERQKLPTAPGRRPAPVRYPWPRSPPAAGRRRSRGCPGSALVRHPGAVGSDADRDDLEALGVEIAQDAACGNTRNRVL